MSDTENTNTTLAALIPSSPGGDITGTSADEVIYSGGLANDGTTGRLTSNSSHNSQSINGGRGSDVLVLNSDDLHLDNKASFNFGRIIVRDFTVANIQENSHADRFSLGGFLEGEQLNAENIGEYLHVVSHGLSTSIYISKEGDFTPADRELLDYDTRSSFGLDLANQIASGEVSSHADLVVEFTRGHNPTTANFSQITGYADNTVEQFQALIDMGFLDLTTSYEDPNVPQPNEIHGTSDADNLIGLAGVDDDIYSGGVGESGAENIQGVRGSTSEASASHLGSGNDRLIFDADDAYSINAGSGGGHLRIRDFTVGDIETDPDADTIVLGDFLRAGDSTFDGTAADAVRFFHFVNDKLIYVDREGKLGAADDPSRDLINGSYRGIEGGASLFLEFKGVGFDATPNGETLNTEAHIQTLMDLGFLDLSSPSPTPPSPLPTEIQGTEAADNLEGTATDDIIYSGGVSSRTESIQTNGGQDRLVLDNDDSFVADEARSGNGHYRIRDMVFGTVGPAVVGYQEENDVLDIGGFLLGSDLNATNIGDYLHIVSGLYGSERAGIFINREGNFTAQDHINLTNNPSAGGHGADLFIELQGRSSNNNIAEVTGYADNTVEQFQALIDFGFLDLSNANSERPVIDSPIDPDQPLIVWGNTDSGTIKGSEGDDIIYPGDISQNITEHVYSNGGSDTLVFSDQYTVATNDANDSHGHFRIKDFIIDDIATNSEADILDLSDLLSGANHTAETLGSYLHIISGVYGNDRAGIFVDKDGLFTDADRQALGANVAAGGHGADLFLEFQGQAGTNNLETITGYTDNSIAQIQALMDMGFLETV